MTDMQPVTPTEVTLTGESAVETKRATALQRAETTRQIARMQAELAEQEAAFKAQREALDIELRRRKDELAERMRPLQQEIAKLEEVAWTVDLYLGRDEEIELLMDGKPAPADTPITIRQMVLAMDEESLVHVEDGGIDIRSVPDFLTWLTASPENRDRIIPDQRGVVVMVPSRQRRDYGDAWMTAKIAAENRTPHWIIRNGERLYLLVTGAERGDNGLTVGENLLPSRNEFVDVFYKRSGFGGRGERVPMEPGSDEWVKAEARVSALQRHYMRVMLVLQGLVDRSVAFHPLPEGGVNLMSLAAQDSGAVRILDETAMVLTDGRESFRSYQRRLNALLRPGMRVIGNFTAQEWRDLYESGDRYARGGHTRLHPRSAPNPESNVPLLIKGRVSGGGFKVTYPRGKVYVDRYEPDPDKPGWLRWVGERDAKTMASATLYPADGFILPYDLVDVADLQRFLMSRAERKNYLSMVPVLRAAIAAKTAEAQAEAPFRDLLVATLSAKHDVDPAEVRAELDALITWWKTGNKWFRPLQGAPEDEARAMASIGREYASRRKAAANTDKDATLARVGREAPGAIAVVTLRSGKTYAYAPAAEGEQVYLTRTEVTAAGLGKVEQWVQVPIRTLSTARTLWETDAWKGWDHAALRGDHLTGPEREQVIERVLAAMHGTPILITEQQRKSYSKDAARLFEGFSWKPGVDLSDMEDTDHWRRGINARLSVVNVTWKRSTGGAVEVTVHEGARDTRWDRYSMGGFGEGPRVERPYKIPGEQFYNPGDPVLVWSDPVQMARVEEWKRAYTEYQRRNSPDDSVGWEEAVVIRDAFKDAWMARETAKERARFDEDFGAADDLWDHHLSTLRLDRRFKFPDWCDPLSRRIARAGIDWDGKTIADLMALDPTTKPVDRDKWDGDAELVLTRPQD